MLLLWAISLRWECCQLSPPLWRGDWLSPASCYTQLCRPNVPTSEWGFDELVLPTLICSPLFRTLRHESMILGWKRTWEKYTAPQILLLSNSKAWFLNQASTSHVFLPSSQFYTGGAPALKANRLTSSLRCTQVFMNSRKDTAVAKSEIITALLFELLSLQVTISSHNLIWKMRYHGLMR